MKNTIKILGLLLFVAIIGFSFAACKEVEEEDVLDGTTWEFTTDSGLYIVVTFSKPNWTQTITSPSGGSPATSSELYSISGNTVTIKTE